MDLRYTQGEITALNRTLHTLLTLNLKQHGQIMFIQNVVSNQLYTKFLNGVNVVFEANEVIQSIWVWSILARYT